MRRTIVYATAVFLLTAVPLAAQQVGGLVERDTGKISGTVQDANNGEALPGANIAIQGTKMGAAADAKGQYTIRNIPPGSYNVEVTMIGFKNVIYKEVRVQENLTTRVDFELEAVSLDLGEAVSLRERDLVASRGRERLILRGVVLDAGTGVGVEGARVLVTNSGARDQSVFGTETDKNGKFEISPVWGVFNIRVKKTGYESWSDVEVPVSQEGKLLTIELRRAMPIQTKVFSIKYKDPREIRRLIGPLVSDDYSSSHTISDNPALGTLTVRARVDILRKMEELILEYDVPPHQIRLDIQLVLATDDESARQPFPKELEPIKKKLSDLFRYSQYSLVGSTNALVFENEKCEMTMGNVNYRVMINKVEYFINAGVIKLSGFNLAGKQAHLSTSVNISDGDTVILGKTSTSDPNEALITIVKAEVVE